MISTGDAKRSLQTEGSIKVVADAVLQAAQAQDPSAVFYLYLDNGYLIVRADVTETVLQRLPSQLGAL